MIVVSDTLSDCILFIKFFDNYARVLWCYIACILEIGGT